MANPEIDNYMFDDKVIRDQDFSNYYKHIFTLKSGKQIEVSTQKSYDGIADEYSTDTHRVIKGFVLTPLVVKKIIRIRKSEIAAREEIKEPCIVHTVPLLEALKIEGEDFVGVSNEHPINCNCSECSVSHELQQHNTKAVEEMTTKELVENK